MKITIDTQVDTYDDIKKVLHILTGIIEKKDVTIQSNFTSRSSYPSSNTDTTSMMNMFDDEPKKDVPDTPPNFNSFLNLVNKKQEEEKRDINYKVEIF